MKKPITNYPASIRQKLLNLAKATNRPFNEILQYYAMERFLFRLSKSKYADRFCLKGALILHVWQGERSRVTKDIDMLARVTNSVDNLVEIIKECIAINFPEDGLTFSATSVRGAEIRKDAEYQGVRVILTGTLETARLRLQLDFGFGDVIFPQPQQIEYPVLLELEKPRLLGYTPESVIAEKFQAMIELDLLNTRMKDFFDIWSLAQRQDFDGELLVQDQATFC